ncbi:lytic transglycosylase domain-containing protein [Marinobacter sp. SS13-12]|uniref:lytic transglycosylase domain-containing protein n=1 Tax=Marinobacter sp. SS13-12 TaxID=3050451 RepID=UPI002556FE3A|nr:lytic transglycosylase domain-containing protein [Marinobacter sp. SS13-12]MDK8465885.1 lytic transglycosylase domain-containing protein [Marinobacter sp. SS13-12]
MNLLRVSPLLILAMTASTGFASPNIEQCFSEAAGRYQVPTRLLKAIALVESNNQTDAINGNNSDGSRDYGLMQINSQHLERLRPYRITAPVLVRDPCANIHVGAWILAENLVTTKGNLWAAVGAYNAGFSTKPKVQRARLNYVAKVRNALQRIGE